MTRKRLQSSATVPAELERTGVLLPAGAAVNGRAGGPPPQVLVDEGLGPNRIAFLVHPELGERGIDGNLPSEAGGVGVEDAGADGSARQLVEE